MPVRIRQQSPPPGAPVNLRLRVEVRVHTEAPLSGHVCMCKAMHGCCLGRRFPRDLVPAQHELW